MKEYTEAVKDMKKIVHLDSFDSDAWWRLGWYSLFSRDFNDALFASQKAWQLLDYEEPMPLINKAHAYLFLKQYSMADEIYDEYADYQYTDSTEYRSAIITDFNDFRNAGLVDDEIEAQMIKIQKRLFTN